MTKEETISLIMGKVSCLDTTKLCELVWDAAIEAAAESAEAKQEATGYFVTVYVDKESILDLKFNK